MRAWRRLTFSVPEALEEELIVRLHELGTLGVESAGGRLRAYFPEGSDGTDLLDFLGAAPGLSAGRIELESSERVADGFWHERWMQGLQPLELGRGFLVAPGPVSAPGGRGRRLIRLTPGLAFGTGDHPTTRMCLELMEDVVRPGDTVLDAGTGSGVLSIAARLLGAGMVVALDIDDAVVETAARNLAINGAGDVLLVVGGLDALGPRAFDLVVANIGGAAFVRSMRRVAGLARREAILSGILLEEEREVAAAAAGAGLRVARRLEDGDWIALAMARGSHV